MIYYATNERFGSEVFVHRPTFPADMFAGLSGKEAQSAYDGAIDRLIGELQAHRVSDEQIQQMMKIPSNELIKLSTALPTDSPWLDEWLAAKCGPTESTTGTNYKALLCKVDAVTSEERRVQRKS